MDGFVNQAASLGGAIAGQRGSVQLLFINNTPFRAVFTAGTYDQLDSASQPDFLQFGPDDGDITFDGGTSSEILSVDCGRVFAIGSPKLHDLIEMNLPDAPRNENALVAGVSFIEPPDGESGEPVERGAAPAFEALLGVDFPCNSLLILRLETDDLGPDPFRIAFELIPSQSDR